MKKIINILVACGLLSWLTVCFAQPAGPDPAGTAKGNSGIAETRGSIAQRSGGVDEDQYSGSEPSKWNMEGKMGTEQRKIDNSSRIPREFDKRR